MPIKMFTCVICGKEVTRKKSYAYKNGRACRIHEKVMQDFLKREKERKNDIELNFKNTKNKQNHLYNREPLFIPTLSCWFCGKEGIDYSDYIYRILVTINRPDKQDHISEFLLYGKGPITEKVRKDIGDKIIVRKFENINLSKDQVHNMLNDTFKSIYKFTNVFIACPECCKKNSIQFAPVVKPPSIETLHMIGSFITPIFKEIAKEEMRVEN